MRIQLLLLSMLISNGTIMRADAIEVSPTIHQEELVDAKEGVDESADEQEDAFDALMNSDVPAGMITPPEPGSVWQGYINQIGGSLLMNYIALKIWLEHQLNAASTYYYGTKK